MKTGKLIILIILLLVLEIDFQLLTNYIPLYVQILIACISIIAIAILINVTIVQNRKEALEELNSSIVETKDSINSRITRTNDSSIHHMDEIDSLIKEDMKNKFTNLYSLLNDKITTEISKAVTSIKSETTNQNKELKAVISKNSDSLIKLTTLCDNIIKGNDSLSIETRSYYDGIKSDLLVLFQDYYKLLLYLSPSKGSISKDNNRKIETIKDEITKNTIIKTFENDVIDNICIKNEGGKKVYLMEYKAGVLFQTKLFDSNENLLIEQTYHSNGQVHFRKEHANGSIAITEFDERGTKK